MADASDEVVDAAEPDDMSDTNDGGASAGRPRREVTLHERPADGCGAGGVSILALACVPVAMLTRRRRSMGAAR